MTHIPGALWKGINDIDAQGRMCPYLVFSNKRYTDVLDGDIRDICDQGSSYWKRKIVLKLEDCLVMLKHRTGIQPQATGVVDGIIKILKHKDFPNYVRELTPNMKIIQSLMDRDTDKLNQEINDIITKAGGLSTRLDAEKGCIHVSSTVDPLDFFQQIPSKYRKLINFEQCCIYTGGDD